MISGSATGAIELGKTDDHVISLSGIDQIGSFWDYTPHQSCLNRKSGYPLGGLLLLLSDFSMGIHTIDSQDRHSVDSLPWYQGLAIAGLVGVLLFTLFPYDFSLIQNFSFDRILDQFMDDQITGLKDLLEIGVTILLFIPLSFGLAGLLAQEGVRRPWNCGLVLGLCTGLGLITELLHTVLLGRHTNVFDIAGAAIGAIAGWGVWWQYRTAIVLRLAAASDRLRQHSTPRNWAIAGLSYSLLATLGLILLPTATHLNNWNANFPLVVGNEFFGGRPWQGEISHLQFFDQELPIGAIAERFEQPAAVPSSNASAPNALRAAYQFTQPPYRDQTGQLADLVWKQPPTGNSPANVARIQRDHWLYAEAVQPLNQAIQQQAQFTVDVIVTPENLQQGGPARMVSLSQDSRNRNLTLGQSGRDFVIRLRTPITGRNGANPPIAVPQVFTDQSPRHLIVTYRNPTLRVYVDGIEQVYITHLPHYGYRLVYYGAMFIPLGAVFAGLAIATTQHHPNGHLRRLVLLLGSLGVMSVGLELLLAISDQRPLQPINIMISIGLGLLAFSLTQRPLQHWLTNPAPR